MNLSPRRALAWSFAERYAGVCLGIASTLILSRLLTPAQVGIYSLCGALMAVAGILRDFGVSEYLIQERELSHDKLRASYSIAFAVAWTIAGAIFLSRHLVASLFGEPRVADVLAVMTLQVALLPMSSPAFALLNRELAFRSIFGLQTACNIAQVLTSVSLAATGHGTMSLAWGPVAGVAVQTAILLAICPRSSFAWPSLRGIRTVLRFGMLYMGSRAIETLAKNIHEPVIAKTFDFASVGLFSRAYGMVEMFHSNVTDAVVRVTTPAFAARHRDNQHIGQDFARATAMFVSVSWPFFGFVALASEEIVRLLFGPQWVAAAPLASILALAALPAGLCELVPQMLSATGHVQRRLRLSSLVVPFHVAGVVLASRIGLQVVAAVSFFSSALMLVLCARQLREVLGMRVWELLRPSLGSAVVAAAALATMAAILLPARALGLPPIVILLLVLGAGTLAWGIVARALNHPIYAELTRAISGFVPSARHGS